MTRQGFVERPGTRIAWRAVGDGPPVVFVQGVGVPGRGWDPQTERLADGYTCVSFDHRGLGDSGPVPGALSVGDLVGDTLAVMDHLGLSGAHLVGHSMGGIVCQEVALTARSRVRSLALLCTFLRGKDAARLTADIVWLGLRTRVGTRRMRRRAFLEMIVPPAALVGADVDALATHYGAVFGRDLADAPAVVTAQLRALSRHDGGPVDALSGIPTLVVSAVHDRLALVDYGRELARRIAGAAYVELPDAAHGAPVADPERIDALLRAHLSSASR